MYSILERHRQYPTILLRDGKKICIRENKGEKKGAYAQKLFTKEAINYTNQDHASPFFVMLAYSSPHAELAFPNKYSAPYKEKPYAGMST